MSAVKERSGEQWVLMQARRLGFGRNPLRRPVDRVESVVLWCALIAGLLLIPVGAAAGTSYRNSSDAAAAAKRAVLHEVTARAVEGTERHVPSAPGDTLSHVRIAYVDQRGVEREGITSVVIGTKAGDEVPVWLDKEGDVVPAPRSGLDSAAVGSMIGMFVIAGSWLALWGLVRLARIPLDRRRARDWASEWDSVAPRWMR
ncbi:Rv1733c family protein [Kribbella sp. NPDC002412]